MEELATPGQADDGLTSVFVSEIRESHSCVGLKYIPRIIALVLTHISTRRLKSKFFCFVSFLRKNQLARATIEVALFV